MELHTKPLESAGRFTCVALVWRVLVGHRMRPRKLKLCKFDLALAVSERRCARLAPVAPLLERLPAKLCTLPINKVVFKILWGVFFKRSAATIRPKREAPTRHAV